MNTNEYNAKLCELLARKHSLNNFVEREARQYPAVGTRQRHRERARKLQGWAELLAEIKAHTKPHEPIVRGQYNRNGYSIWIGDRLEYSADNHAKDSTQTAHRDDERLPLRVLRSFCIKQVRGAAQDCGGRFGRVARVEEEE
jgi:hypothetical protein